MRRLSVPARDNWPSIVESQGFHFHSLDDEPYWDETICYALSRTEVDAVEKATYTLNELCLAAVEHVIANGLLDQFGIPPAFHDWIRLSWEEDEHSLYGRFDLGLPRDGVPRLLEYNADTPTALLEAAVIQWFWLRDTHEGCDQFNNLHERLIEIWKIIADDVEGPIHFASSRGSIEDYMTANYLRDTAMQAGAETRYLAVEEIAWNAARGEFVDGSEQAIRTIFKLYPWEWMLREEFGPHLLKCQTRWLEPPWKMILSNKAILPLLWQLFPQCPYLLRTEHEPFGGSYVKKPLLGREGANVTVVFGGQAIIETEGPYEGPYVYQEVCPLPETFGNYAVLGSWIVNGYACGVGIREDLQMVTQNTSRFVPHFIE